jgi:hypothetical protein
MAHKNVHNDWQPLVHHCSLLSAPSFIMHTKHILSNSSGSRLKHFPLPNPSHPSTALCVWSPQVACDDATLDVSEIGSDMAIGG